MKYLAKNHSLKILLTATIAIATIDSNTALTQESDDPYKAFANSPCKGATEVNYRSQKLQSPDNKTVIYFEVILRRIVPEKNPFAYLDYCWGNIQTPRLEMVIEENNNTRRIDYGEADRMHLIINPVSFSPDSRFVITENSYAYEGGDPGLSNSIVDLSVAEPKLSVNPCQETDFSEYSGFISDTEVAFSCSGYADTETWLETINLNTLAANRLTKVPSNTAKLSRIYGDVIEELTVTKTQVFP